MGGGNGGEARLKAVLALIAALAYLKVHYRDTGLDRAWAVGLSGYAATGDIPLKCNLEQTKHGLSENEEPPESTWVELD